MGLIVGLGLHRTDVIDATLQMCRIYYMLILNRITLENWVAYFVALQTPVTQLRR
jgi:hypothetical protein